MRKTVKLSRTSESPPDKPLPEFVVPMACYVKEPIDSLDWIFETKLECYRAIAVIDSAGKARLWSRNHLPPEPEFPTIGCAVNQPESPFNDSRW
jgi:ATP-dependent DNA ligase